MPLRKAEAVWEGNLKDGKGRMKLGSGAFEVAYSCIRNITFLAGLTG